MQPPQGDEPKNMGTQQQICKIRSSGRKIRKRPRENICLVPWEVTASQIQHAWATWNSDLTCTKDRCSCGTIGQLPLKSVRTDISSRNYKYQDMYYWLNKPL